MAKIFVFYKKESVSSAMTWCDNGLDQNSEYCIKNGKGVEKFLNQGDLITGDTYNCNRFKRNDNFNKANYWQVETLKVKQNEEL